MNIEPLTQAEEQTLSFLLTKANTREVLIAIVAVNAVKEAFDIIDEVDQEIVQKIKDLLDL